MSEQNNATIVSEPLKAETRKFNFYYGDNHALKNVDLPVAERMVTALIGPSGCGKSTLLRSFNRMHDLYPGNRYEGEIRLYPDDVNLVSPAVDPIEIRMRISMVFQKPNPFPKTIFENVAYGLMVRGEKRRSVLEEKVEEALRGAALWEEVKDRLDDLAFNLRGAAAAAVASPGRWRPIRRSSSSTNPPRRSIPSPRRASRSSSPRSRKR